MLRLPAIRKLQRSSRPSPKSSTYPPPSKRLITNRAWYTDRLGAQVKLPGIGSRRFRVHVNGRRLTFSTGSRMPLSVGCEIRPGPGGSRLVLRADSPALLVLACLAIAMLIVAGYWMYSDYAAGRITAGPPVFAACVMLTGVVSTWLNWLLARSAVDDLARILTNEVQQVASETQSFGPERRRQ